MVVLWFVLALVLLLAAIFLLRLDKQNKDRRNGGAREGIDSASAARTSAAGGGQAAAPGQAPLAGGVPAGGPNGEPGAPALGPDGKPMTPVAADEQGVRVPPFAKTLEDKDAGREIPDALEPAPAAAAGHSEASAPAAPSASAAPAVAGAPGSPGHADQADHPATPVAPAAGRPPIRPVGAAKPAAVSNSQDVQGTQGNHGAQGAPQPQPRSEQGSQWPTAAPDAQASGQGQEQRQAQGARVAPDARHEQDPGEQRFPQGQAYPEKQPYPQNVPVAEQAPAWDADTAETADNVDEPKPAKRRGLGKLISGLGSRAKGAGAAGTAAGAGAAGVAAVGLGATHGRRDNADVESAPQGGEDGAPEEGAADGVNRESALAGAQEQWLEARAFAEIPSGQASPVAAEPVDGLAETRRTFAGTFRGSDVLVSFAGARTVFSVSRSGPSTTTFSVERTRTDVEGDDAAEQMTLRSDDEAADALLEDPRVVTALRGAPAGFRHCEVTAGWGHVAVPEDAIDQYDASIVTLHGLVSAAASLPSQSSGPLDLSATDPGNAGVGRAPAEGEQKPPRVVDDEEFETDVEDLGDDLEPLEVDETKATFEPRGQGRPGHLRLVRDGRRADDGASSDTKGAAEPERKSTKDQDASGGTSADGDSSAPFVGAAAAAGAASLAGGVIAAGKGGSDKPDERDEGSRADATASSRVSGSTEAESAPTRADSEERAGAESDLASGRESSPESSQESSPGSDSKSGAQSGATATSAAPNSPTTSAEAAPAEPDRFEAVMRADSASVPADRGDVAADFLPQRSPVPRPLRGSGASYGGDATMPALAEPELGGSGDEKHVFKPLGAADDSAEESSEAIGDEIRRFESTRVETPNAGPNSDMASAPDSESASESEPATEKATEKTPEKQPEQTPEEQPGSARESGERAGAGTSTAAAEAEANTDADTGAAAGTTAQETAPSRSGEAQGGRRRAGEGRPSFLTTHAGATSGGGRHRRADDDATADTDDTQNAAPKDSTAKNDKQGATDAGNAAKSASPAGNPPAGRAPAGGAMDPDFVETTRIRLPGTRGAGTGSGSHRGSAGSSTPTDANDTDDTSSPGDDEK